MHHLVPRANLGQAEGAHSRTSKPPVDGSRPTTETQSGLDAMVAENLLW